MSDDEVVAEEVEREEPDGEDAVVGTSGCVGREPARCLVDDGCVRSPDGSCREAGDECELIELDLRAPTPAMDAGDPCERANADCAWNTATGRCSRFAAVPSCPATAEEAAELRVFCDHSQQSALRCNFPGTQCACRRTPYCGGAAPPPEQQYPPGVFSCVPDFDDRGCPTRDPPANARCDLDPSVQCQVGCYGLYTCEGGRWRRRQLPPRP